jgi:hypothetical protein
MPAGLLHSDKFLKEHRVYVATEDVERALRCGGSVLHRAELESSERTHAWTVCLTAGGIVDFLNRRISPLGVDCFYLK